MYNFKSFTSRDLKELRVGVTIPCLMLCVTFFIVIGITPLLTSAFTQPLRPLMIMACLLIPGKYAFRANKTIWVFGIYLFYLTLIFLCHDFTHKAFMAWMSALLFGTFFIVVSQRMWSTKEIRILLIVIFASTICFTLLLHHYNHDLFHNASSVTFNGKHLNANAAAYTISPGALCGVFLSLYYSHNLKHKTLFKCITILGTLLCFYSLVCLGQRSAFFSFVLGSVMVIWEKCGKAHRATALRTILILIISIGFFLGPSVTKGTHAERLFDYDKISDDNGRDDLNDRAKELISQKPFFGGGFEYWDNESHKNLGLHNGFYSAMVVGGFTGGILISLFFIYLLIEVCKMRSLIPIAFILEAAAHMFLDSGLDYFTYIPLILAYLLVRSADFRGISVEEIV